MTLHDGKRLEPGSGPVVGDSPLPKPVPSWTFLVYMAGDNNLEQFGLLDLAEMKAIGSTADVNIVAQFDRMTDGVTRRYHLHHDTPLDEDQVGPELGETNSGDPRELARFLAWAVEAYPAERYALVVWNHGTGWKEDDLYASLRLSTGAPPTRIPSSRPDTDHARLLAREVAQRRQRPVLFSDSIDAIIARGIGYDDTSSDFLDNSELQRAIDAGLLLTGVDKLTLLGFDACLMSMIEVAYQVKDLAEVMVSSQETEPGEGWPYGDILAQLVANPGMDGAALAACIVDTYMGGFVEAESATLSSLDLGRIDEVRIALDHLCAYVMENIEACEYIMGRASRRAQKYADEDYKDLCDLCLRIIERSTDMPDLAQHAQAVVDAIDPAGLERFVLHERHLGYLSAASHGVSIYYPAHDMSPFYRRLDFSSEGLWDDMLHMLFGV